MKKICFVVTAALVFICSCNSPTTIKKGDTVAIYFILKTATGQVVDDTYQPTGKLPLLFVTGNNEVIPGIEKALLGHCAGDSVSAQILPEDAYGKDGVYYWSPSHEIMYIIPPNDTLVLEIEIMSVKKRNKFSLWELINLKSE